MARKKHEEDAPDTGGWINTFADLMNLLLCFFVLLFSMSTVDADKYEALVTSMSEKINIFEGGGSAVGKGAFVSSGTSQNVSVAQYFNEFENTGEDTDSQEDQSTENSGDKKTDENQETGGSSGSESVDDDTKKKVEDAQVEDQKKAAEELYGGVLEAARKSNIEDQITINTDKAFQYVQISLNGGILFDSGSAELRNSCKSLLTKVGDILKLYDRHMIKIEGHTDNVPVSGTYRSNMRLSSARAIEVYEYLVSKKKLSEESLEATGRGEVEPVASNKTAAGRAKNRRVELKIYTRNDINNTKR